MRLIDADAVKRILDGRRFKYIRNFLNKQPTIDAVPVVRCKDCEFYDPRGYCDHIHWEDAEGWSKPVDPDDFCSHGERKGGEEDGQ